VERFHKTLRREFLTGKVFASIDDAQAQIDNWVREYNFERPHQSLGMAVPWDRFQLARPNRVEADKPITVADDDTRPTTTRHVGSNGLISFASASYRAGVWLAGEDVTVICDGGLVHLHHSGVLIATHARKHAVDKQQAGLRRGQRPAPAKRPSSTAPSVTRKVDSSGNVCFAGTNYYASTKYIRRQIQVAIVGETVELFIGEQLIRTHPIRHDRTREHGALANPGGRPRRTNAA
jgi:Integrase core domain